MEELSADQREQLKSALADCGFELMDDKKGVTYRKVKKYHC